MVMPEFEKILNHENLNADQAETLMDFLISDNSTDELRASFLASMFIKKVLAEELAGFSRSLRNSAMITRIPGLTDIVGTGGDHMNTVNVSTASAIVASASGIRIGKHGNHASTGLHGSADFLKKLGYSFEMSGEEIRSNLERHSFVFILANHYNSHFAKFSGVRRKLGFSSVLNLLGPVTNPLDPDTVVIGCTSMDIAKIYSEVLLDGKKKGCVITAEDGMDEISPVSPTSIFFVENGIREQTVYPEDFELNGTTMDDISSPDPSAIHSRTVAGLNGSNSRVSRYIALNTAPALLLNGKGKSLQESFGIALNLIEDGSAGRKMASIGGAS